MSAILAGITNEEDAESDGLVKGVAIGVVTQNRDDAGMGRVKLKFPWREKETESDWARIAVTMAGPDRGTYFLPEVGDEVLVAFERGDIRHPYVLGALWNGEDAPPETNGDGNNDVRKFTSRKGHELIFNDGASPYIEVHTHDNKKLYLDENKIEIDDGGGNKIVIDTNGGSIKLESTTSISVTSPKINLDASGTMNIKAGGTLTIQGALVQIN